MTTERVQARRETLYQYLRAHPHTALTLAEVAYGLGRSPGTAFTMDLAQVRHWAREDDAIVTNCAWSDDVQGFAFHYLPPKDERDLATVPQRTQSRRMRTAVRNNGSQAAYLARHGSTRQARAYGSLNVQVSDAIGSVFEAIEQYDRAMRTTPSTGSNGGQ